jgi:hypothetical protein
MPESHENSLVNDGWTKMSAMLDDAMPVRRKKRPVLPFLLLLGVLLSAAGFLLIPNNTGPTKPDTPVSTPKATVPSATPQAALPPAPPIAERQTNISSSATAAIPAEAAAAAPIVLMNEIQDEMPTDLTFFSPFRGMDTLARLDLKPLDLANEEIILSGLANPRKSGSWRLGVEMAAGFSGQQWAVGPVISRPVGEQFYFRTGLQLSSGNYNLVLQQSYQERFSTPDFSTGSMASSSAEALTQSIADGQVWAIQTTALQVPLLVGWKLNSRLSVETGLAPVFIFSKETVWGQYFMTNLAINFSLIDLSSTIIATTRHLDLRGFAGMRYALSPKWSLGMHFQHNLVNLQRLDALQTRQDRVQISAMCYF